MRKETSRFYKHLMSKRTEQNDLKYDEDQPKRNLTKYARGIKEL